MNSIDGWKFTWITWKEKEKKCTIICQLESDEKGRHRAESQMDVGETDWISKV